MTEQQLKAREAAALELARKLLNAADGTHHNTVLEALMYAYTTVAVTHPCCTEGAAQACIAASMRLMAHAAGARPAGTPTH